jgi:hypothetical protein
VCGRRLGGRAGLHLLNPFVINYYCLGQHV